MQTQHFQFSPSISIHYLEGFACIKESHDLPPEAYTIQRIPFLEMIEDDDEELDQLNDSDQENIDPNSQLGIQMEILGSDNGSTSGTDSWSVISTPSGPISQSGDLVVIMPSDQSEGDIIRIRYNTNEDPKVTWQRICQEAAHSYADQMGLTHHAVCACCT